MGRNTSSFKLSAMGSGGTIRVGDLIDNPSVVLSDVEIGGSSMGRKLTESKERSVGAVGDSLHDSIRKHGIKNPVALRAEDNGKITVLSGHHRIAAANDINPDMIIPYLHFTKDFSPNMFQHEAAGNCPNCYGDGQELDEDGNMLGNCTTCGGDGVV